MFDWAFDEDAPLHRDLQMLSEQKDDLVPLVVRMKFPDDFPFAAPLVYCAAPVLASPYIFDGALCMEMLVDWQPTYGNVEALLVQIASFLTATNTRVASLCSEQERSAAAGGQGVQNPRAAGGVQAPPPPPPLAEAQPQPQPGQQQQPQQPPPLQPPIAPPPQPPPEAAVDVTDTDAGPSRSDEELEAKAQLAYEGLRKFHARKGWGQRAQDA